MVVSPDNYQPCKQDAVAKLWGRTVIEFIQWKESHSFMLQRRGVSRNTLILEYLRPASDWSKITMDHVEGSDWFLEICI